MQGIYRITQLANRNTTVEDFTDTTYEEPEFKECNGKVAFLEILEKPTDCLATIGHFKRWSLPVAWEYIPDE